MDYYFNGSEIFINNITFLGKTICNDYDYLNLKPIIVDEAFDNGEIKSEIHVSKCLWTEEFKEKQVTTFTFNIFSEEQTDVVLFFDIPPAVKLWLNDEIIFSKNEYICGIYCRTLKKGKNTFYGEFFTTKAAGSYFACRISSYNMENNRKYDNILDSKSLLVNRPTVDFFATDEASYMDSKQYTDCIFPRDIFKLDIKSNIILNVFAGNSDEAIDSLILKYNQKYILDLDKYRQQLDSDTHGIILKYSFKEYGGNIQTTYRIVVIKDFIYETVSMIDKEKKTDILWEHIGNRLGRLKENPQQFYAYYLKLSEKYKNLSYNKRNLHGGNIAEINVDSNYFKSKLDEKIERYFIRKPKKYDKNKKYPLFLFISINNSISYYSYLISNDNYFIADAAGRGVTGGSCIGEASILEVLSCIKQNYNIDDKKIYLVGYSNGGHASANLIQHHPDMFAGTFTVSARCNKDLICNIQDKKCINIYSDFDARNPNKCFSDESVSDSLIDINSPTLNHRFLGSYIAQKTVFNELLNERLDPYPKHIHAKTSSLQHRKYYWFEFLDISFGSKYAEVDISICDDNKIKINIENCDIFKIQIPFNTENIVFDINGQKINTNVPQTGYLIFEKSNSGFYVSEEKERSLSLKGTGILTVYYEPLQIYITNKDPILEKIANNFSSPYTNGYDPKVYTEYPIKSANNFDSEKNAVFIDDLSNDRISETIRSNLFVKLSKDGFEYNGKKYYGDYSILQVIRSPFNKCKAILHISTNNKEFMQKNIFLRRVILSFDFNGRNPHWNNEALIFYNNKYYTIYENNGEIKAYFDDEKIKNSRL